MSGCYAPGDFKKYFVENMEALGLDVPSGFAETFNLALEKATLMLSALNTLGSSATIAELVGATTGLEQLMVLGAMSASYYVGAFVGSLAVAAGRSMACGTSISDFFVFIFIRRHNLDFKGWQNFYARNPAVLDSNWPFRSSFAARARTSRHFEYA